MSSPGVVVVRDVGVVRRQDRFLLDQPAARVERVGQTAVEAAHAQAVEDDLHAFADAARRGATQPERALHVARPIGVGRRIVEEGVPPAPALACLALIERTCAADDGFAVGPMDVMSGCAGSSENVARQTRAVSSGQVTRHGVVAADDGDRPRLHAGEIERHRHGRRLQAG